MKLRTITASGKLCHDTNIFRDSEVFRHLPKYLQGRFETQQRQSEPISVHVGACSQGEDIWSVMITIAKGMDLNLDQFNFIASDISRDVLAFAKAGLVKLIDPTIRKVNEEFPDLNFMGFFDQDEKHTHKYRRLLEQSDLKFDTRKKDKHDKPIYKPASEVAVPLGSVAKIIDGFLERVKFKVVNFYKQQKSSFTKPCLVFFRHQLRHFKQAERQRFAASMHRLLEPGSTIIVGSGDQADRDVAYLTHDQDDHKLFERKFIPETNLGVIFERN